MIDIKEATIRGRSIIEDGRVFNIDRSKYMNASEAGGCIRKQWYDKHEPKLRAPEDLGYAWRGQAGEHYMIESLLQANVPLAIHGEQHSIADDETRIAATPDDVITYDDEWIPLEIKTIDPRTNRRNLPRDAHVTQLKIAMALVDQYHDNPGIKRGLLVYMDASNFNDIVQFEIEFDAGILERLAPRARKILNTKKVDNLDREGKANGDCKYCPFTEACGVDVADTKTKSGRGNKGTSLDASAGVYIELKESIAEMKATQDVVKEDLKRELKRRKTNEITVGGIEVKLTETAGRASLDKKAAKKAGIDLSPFESVGAPGERLDVNRVT